MDYTDYQEKAKEAVAHVVNRAAEEEAGEYPFSIAAVAAPSDFYVVWFAKTLKNWKALVSTDLVNDQYFEVTHNGDNGDTYVDWYTKKSNSLIGANILNNG